MSRGFSELNNRYTIRGRLEVCAPMHVGSGFEDVSMGSDAGFMGDAGGIFVPGSSLRGVLRSTLERILQSLEPKRGCVLFATDPDYHCPTAWKDDDPRKIKLQEMRDEGELMRRLLAEDGLCDVCRLFGSPLMASKLRFSDARPANGAARLNKRDGVGIDRDTESAREKIKFDFMALEPFAGGGKEPLELTFELQIENADDNDLALTGILLRELSANGVDAGGKKARGFGRVRLKPDYSVSYFDKASLREFLKTGQFKTMTGADFEALLGVKTSEYFDRCFGEADHA